MSLKTTVNGTTKTIHKNIPLDQKNVQCPICKHLADYDKEPMCSHFIKAIKHAKSVTFEFVDTILQVKEIVRNPPESSHLPAVIKHDEYSEILKRFDALELKLDPPNKKWYKSFGIWVSLLLVIGLLYFIYLWIMTERGFNVRLPGWIH